MKRNGLASVDYVVDDRDETINQIISEYSKSTQKEYKIGYDWMGKVIFWELCKKL